MTDGCSKLGSAETLGGEQGHHGDQQPFILEKSHWLSCRSSGGCSFEFLTSVLSHDHHSLQYLLPQNTLPFFRGVTLACGVRLRPGSVLQLFRSPRVWLTGSESAVTFGAPKAWWQHRRSAPALSVRQQGHVLLIKITCFKSVIT